MDRDEALKRDKEIMDRAYAHLDDVTCWVGVGGFSADGADTMETHQFPIARLLASTPVPVTPFPWPKTMHFGRAMMVVGDESQVLFVIFDPEKPHLPMLSVPFDEDNYKDFTATFKATNGLWVVELWTPKKLHRAAYKMDRLIQTNEFDMDPEMYRAQRDGDNDVPSLEKLRREAMKEANRDN
jgi:hypothetical protein